MPSSSTDDILKSIENKLSTIIKVVGLDTVKGERIEEQVRILDAIGLNSIEIGNLLGKDDSTIRHYLLDLRKPKSNKESKVTKSGKEKKSKTR